MKEQTPKPFNLGHFLFLPIVTLILVNLKLLGIIDWSWWIVVSPMVFHAMSILILLFVILLFSIAAVVLCTSSAIRFLEKRIFTTAKPLPPATISIPDEDPKQENSDEQ